MMQGLLPFWGSSKLDGKEFWIVAAIVALSALSKLRQWLQNKKPIDGIPMLPRNHCIYGHLPLLLQVDNFEEVFKLIHKCSNNDGLAGLWVGRHPVLSVSGLDTGRTILQASSERHPVRIFKLFLYKFVGNHNIVTLNGREWKFHRSTVARTFNAVFLQEARRYMKEVAQTAVHSLQNCIVKSSSDNRLEIVDVEVIMKMITMDIFGRTALSTDLGSCHRLASTPLVKAFEFLVEDQMDRIRSPLRLKHLFFCVPTARNKRQKREREVVRSFVADLINEKRDIIKDGDRDLLSHLVLAHALDETNQRLRPQDISDEALTDVLMTLLLLSHYATSTTLTFALYLLAKHPEVQLACAKEINSVPFLENAEEMVYCSAVIWETLRLFPPATLTSRFLDRAVPLGREGFVAPKGIRAHINIWSIHHDESIFPQAESFRPDRWAVPMEENPSRWVERDELDTSQNIPAGNRKAMLAFSAGARSCVGQQFAMQETTIVLATLLKDLEFHLVPGYKFKTTTRNFVQQTDGPLPLSVRMRNRS